MAHGDKQTESAYKRAFLTRTAEARSKAGLTQEEIATLLNIPQDKYKHYEKRSLLPHYLVPAFCIATRIDPAWLFGLPAKRTTSAVNPSSRKFG